MERKLYVKLLLWNANLAIHDSRLEVSQKYSKLWTLFLDFPLSCVGSPEVVVIWFFLLQLNFQFVKKKYSKLIMWWYLNSFGYTKSHEAELAFVKGLGQDECSCHDSNKLKHLRLRHLKLIT